jgi:hypothetical protein
MGGCSVGTHQSRVIVTVVPELVAQFSEEWADISLGDQSLTGGVVQENDVRVTAICLYRLIKNGHRRIGIQPGKHSP